MFFTAQDTKARRVLKVGYLAPLGACRVPTRCHGMRVARLLTKRSFFPWGTSSAHFLPFHKRSDILWPPT